MAPDSYVHPLVLFLSASFALTVTAAYTSRYSPLRYLLLAFLALCAYYFPSTLASFARPTGWAGRVPAGAMFWNIVTSFDRLILRGWDYANYEQATRVEDQKEQIARPDQKMGDTASPESKTRMDFGSEVTSSARGIGLFWEVKNVPYFSTTRPAFVPSRGAFLCMQIVAVAACYHLHNKTIEATFSLDLQYLSDARIPLLTRITEVSSAELKARVITSIGYWIVQCCMMQFFYSAAGIVAAISNPSTIHLWRPLFGSPWDAYSIRNFWGSVSVGVSSREVY